MAVNTSQLGPVTSTADGAAGALVYALVTSAAARHARDDISSQAGCLGLTSPLALIPVALIRMYCELILCYCYSPLLVISVTSIPPSFFSSRRCSVPGALIACTDRQTDRKREREADKIDR